MRAGRIKQHFNIPKGKKFPNLNMSVLSLEWCSPTKCQAQKQNQIVEFNTIKIEELYFQEGEKQRDNCNQCCLHCLGCKLHQ